MYDQLMVELRREDPSSFTNFMRMPPDVRRDPGACQRPIDQAAHFLPRAPRTWPETGGDTATFGLWLKIC